MTFPREKYATTPRHRFAGLKLNTLEVCLVLALADATLWTPEQLSMANLQQMWRRYLAASLAPDEWRKKGWGDYGRMGWRAWFRRTLSSLQHSHKLAGSPLLPTLFLHADRLKACAAAFRETMQPAMPGRDFWTYCQTTYAQLQNRRGA